MGQRSRKRGRTAPKETAPGRPAPERAPADAARPPRRSTEERNAEIRAQLEPLAPGERPWPLKVAVVVAIILASSNIVLWASGYEIKHGDDKSTTGGVLIFAGVIFLAAGGMWMRKYWAVLGFQALLAITVLIASLSLFAASNLWAVLLCTVVILGGGFLFWKLVRVLSRLNMPENPFA